MAVLSGEGRFLSGLDPNGFARGHGLHPLSAWSVARVAARCSSGRPLFLWRQPRYTDHMPARKRPSARSAPLTSHTYWFGVGSFALGILLLVFLLGVVFPLPFGLGGADPAVGPSRQRQTDCERTGRVWEAGYCFPVTEADCQQSGGVWGILGSDSGVGCNFLAPDGGQTCQDGSRCASGRCLAVIDARVREQMASGQDVLGQGFCAGLLRVRGCNAYLSNGRVGSMVCAS